MSEFEIITFIKKGLDFAIKVAEQTGIRNDINYGQAREWLDNKLSEAAAQEVRRWKE